MSTNTQHGGARRNSGPKPGVPSGRKNPNAGRKPTLHLSERTQCYTVTNWMPCATRNGEGICGKPATVVRAWQVMSDRHTGCFLVQPVCQECADEAKQLYQVRFMEREVASYEQFLSDGVQGSVKLA